MKALAARDRRALWLGAALVLPIVAWRVAVVPLASSYADTQARIELTAALLAREQALVRDSAAIGATLRTTRALLENEAASLLAAGDSAAAISAAHATLRAGARAAGLSEIDLETDVGPGLSRVMFTVDVDLRARGAVAALEEWLGRVERSEHAFSVSRLDVAAGTDDLLTVNARVRVLVRREAP